MTLGELKSQVVLLTQHNGISDKVTLWANRVLNDIGTRVFWMNQMGVGFAHHATIANATSAGNAVSHAFSMQTPNASLHEMVAPWAVDQVTLNATGVSGIERPLIRQEIRDLYGIAAGSTPATSNTSQYYAMVRGGMLSSSASTGGTVYAEMVGYPFPATTASSLQAMALTYLGSPALLTTDNSTNWMMQNYPRVVLAGVMARARLYLNDPVGYMMEKGEFENGIADMIRIEEVATANTPVMGGVDDGILGRLQ